jgi:hypothetical protein
MLEGTGRGRSSLAPEGDSVARAKAQKKPATRVSVQETVPRDKATMVVTVYNGARLPIQQNDFLIRIFDGFQNQLFNNDRPAPTTVFELPFKDNPQDNCRVLVSGDGYSGAGSAQLLCL